MSGRLLGLRIQGFKSFAERTRVEFGPGVSAIVGPNGSGKSNLADALRWALGEQGRSLRIRRSEDVIWAGSERRGALGMADVTLILDNADSLLPVDYGVVELGRRLYRSGENEYLVNRQRLRLRDLADLLETANLAENAFLFIGQGMVDQALALRPEERRPLFEEVAGVRRHERRKRRAQTQLEEAEGNLVRVEDVLAELRPQARRLGQLAEQQESRYTAGVELADALVAAAHGRWHEAAARVASGEASSHAARDEATRALEQLEHAEATVASLAAALSARADAERAQRAVLDAARAAAGALEVRAARVVAEQAALGRDRERLVAERSAGEQDLAAHRRLLAEAMPERDADLESALGEADRALGEALAELAALRSAHQARGSALAAAKRAEATRIAEVELARRRIVDAERRAGDEASLAGESAARQATLEVRLADARTALEAATLARRTAADDRAAAADGAEAAEGERRTVAERAARLGSLLAGARGRLEALRRELEEEERRGIARVARRLGGRRVDADLGVDPAFRAAVEAALGERARAYLVDRVTVPKLVEERGQLVVRERIANDGGRNPSPAELRRLDEVVAAVGGGQLAGSIRRDPGGAARALAAGSVWVPDLAAALEVQPFLPSGWVAVTRDGTAVVDGLAVRLGRGDTPLERRVEVERLEREVESLGAEATEAESEAGTAAAVVEAARSSVEAARQREAASAADLRRAEEAERAAGRDAESAAREAAWHAAQAARLAAEVERARTSLAGLEAAARSGGDRSASGTGAAADGLGNPEPALTVWEARVAELRARRDRIGGDMAVADRSRREAEARRARADAAVGMASARISSAERELAGLAERERVLELEHAAVTGGLAATRAREAEAQADLDRVLADDATERERLAAAERDAASARDRLRAAEARMRTTDVGVLEARLALDALREQLLVELAGLTDVGLHRLSEAAGTDTVRLPAIAAGDAQAGDPDHAALLEAALDRVAPAWASRAPDEPPPSPARVATLRRRFHDLGAANPFAVEEYRSLRERLDSLESQHRDLREAIAATRSLIADLDALIATQFRTTFSALEVAFDARFRQLFGGGFARLSLTDPADLAATGVEIVARPPGKKAQALAMLSGGERALTAVALLFAMLEVRPVPFCVLDEVDAALDEANIGRFTDALRELATTMQCIVITHNRGTIEVADALYGVTVGEDSVSRVISLRLDEATALAAAEGVSPASPAGIPA